jgi:KTSC domain-containing protein
MSIEPPSVEREGWEGFSVSQLNRRSEEVRRRPLPSSIVKSVGYDPKLAILEVEFTSGAVYQYFVVPERHFRELVDADSPGQYFNAHVRDKYRFVERE